jgi:hypothetical protein
MTLSTIDYLTNIIARICSYILIYTVVNALSARFYRLMGDDSSEEYTSFDPFIHIDIPGLLIITFLGFGWLKIIPINTSYIRRDSLYPIKVAAMICAGPFIALSLALACLFISVLFFGPQSLFIAAQGMHLVVVPLYALSQIFSVASSSSIGLLFILLAFCFYATLTAAFLFIINSMRLFLQSPLARPLWDLQYGEIIALVLEVIVLIIGLIPLRMIFLYGVIAFTELSARLLGLL